MKYLEIKPEMTTKELAEIVYGRIVEYKTAEYSSIARSLKDLERKGLVKRVQVKLRWRLKKEKLKVDAN